jgi:hypothetical protein
MLSPLLSSGCRGLTQRLGSFFMASLIGALLLSSVATLAIAESSAPPAMKTPFIVINVPERTLSLMDENFRPIKRYPVGLGRPQYPTPLGDFTVLRKVQNPAWENPYLAPGAVRVAAGLNNPLGTRWIGFKQDPKGEYGIHGTPSTKSVGQYSSHGCVRMHIKDAEDVFSRVPNGAAVVVNYDRIRLTTQGNQIALSLWPDVYKRGVPAMALVMQHVYSQYPGSVIDESKLKQALASPLTKPVVVATFNKALSGQPSKTPVHAVEAAMPEGPSAE